MPSSPRWIPRVRELLESILHGQKSFPTPLSDKVKQILSNYSQKLEKSLQSNKPFNYSQPTRSHVFANNYVNLGEMAAIGFDLDYTLVPYTVELQQLIFTMARDQLVSQKDYPMDLKTCFFDSDFAIRGLSVDTRYGILTKLNYLQRVRRRYSYKGKRQITLEEMNEYYGPTRHISYEDLSIMRPLNDLFSMAEACLIADCIEIYEHRKKFKGELYDPGAIIDDVQSVIRDVHVHGDMHRKVMTDLEKYVKVNPKLIELLFHFRKAGKKLFLCTNR